MQVQDAVAIANDLVDAMNHRNMTEVLDYFDDDATLSIEPTLPGTAVGAYSGKERVHSVLLTLFAEHWQVEIQGCEGAQNEATCQVSISADRFAQLGVEPVEAALRIVLDDNLIQSATFSIAPASIQRMMTAMGAAKR